MPAGWRDWQRWVQDVDWSDWRGWLARLAATDWAAGPVPAVRGSRRPRRAKSRWPWGRSPRRPGEAIRDHLATTSPAFSRWWRQGANARPTAAQARARLEEHMPELVPAWQRLTAIVEGPGAADAGPALALWNPPPFLTGCSQAAVLDGGPALIRNYDWDYRLFDAVVASTAYAGRGCSACWTACGDCWTG